MNRLLPAGLPVPVPRNDGLDAPYWNATMVGELRVQQCAHCATYQWGPEWLCHACRSRELAWPVVEPRGRIFSWIRTWHPVHHCLDTAVPYVTLLVELPQAGGIRMVGGLIGDQTTEVTIGAEVVAVFERHVEEPAFALVHWRLSEHS